jgi:epoxyqueuosine reductase
MGADATVLSQMKMASVEKAAANARLSVMGAFHPDQDDPILKDIGTLVLFGPREPGFWMQFCKTPEWQDDQPDAMDRWSSRVIGDLGQKLAAQPFFPFGKPHKPFFTWALKTNRVWASPIHILVHDTAGLMVSFRGALGFSDVIDVPQTGASPCSTCQDKPCLTACPISAITAKGYDVPSCNTYLHSPAGNPCMDQGCAARLACPVSLTYQRDPAQSAYHMSKFRKPI